MISLYPIVSEDEILYIGEAVHPESRDIVHVLSVSALLSSSQNAQNMIVIPVPSQVSLSRRNELLIPFLAREIAVKFNPHMESLSEERLHCELKVLYHATDFEWVNPPIGPEVESLKNLLLEFYPQHQFMVWQWKPFEGRKWFSVTFWYSPAKTDRFLVPTLHGTGVLSFIEIHRKYQIFTSCIEMKAGLYVHGNQHDTHWDLFPLRILGTTVDGWYTNADTVASKESVKAGIIEGIQRTPFFGVSH